MEADYLSEKKSGGVGLDKDTLQNLDATVGFSQAPSSAKLHMAKEHIGTGNVSSAWAYQGSRASYSKGRIHNAQGLHLNCLKASDGTHSWRARSKSSRIGGDDQVFCPPSVGQENLYVCSTIGHLLSLDQESGEVGFLYGTNHPIAFQAALAKGAMYVGTSNGMLLSLETGNDDADGWYMWGGNAQHNKSE